MDAIVLAGGLGTRLGHLTLETPKPMLEVGGRPFIAHLLSYLSRKGVKRAILSVGYLAETFRAHFGSFHSGLEILYSVESSPLGTGGGIRQALHIARGERVLVLNGDTFFDLDLALLLSEHLQQGNDLTLGAKQVPDAARYGTLAIESGRISGFLEKGREGPGVINCGVYLLEKRLAESFPPTEAFSFESDFLAKTAGKLKFGALVADGYFIDMGIPEELERARREFPLLQELR